MPNPVKSLGPNILEQNKEVKKMYVMDIYSVKQPQNIIIKVKMKEQLYLHQEKLSS